MINISIRESKNCNGECSLFLTFPFSNYIVDTVRSMPSRYWDKENKEWEVGFKSLPTLLDALKDYEIKISAEDMSLLMPKPIDVEIPKGFEFKTQPYGYQMDGFKYGLTHNKWLLGDSMGLGKSKQASDIAVAKKIMYGYRHCLVVCGVNGLKWNWLNEIATHTNERGWIIGQKTRNNGNIIIGSNTDKYNQIVDVMDNNDSPINDCYFLITNIESLRDESIVSALSSLCDSGVIGTIICDEIHKGAANPNSQQGKGLLKLNAKNMIAMTGTPLMNKPMDLYGILKWLGYEKHSMYAFKKHFCIMGGYGGYEIIGYKNLGELQEQLDEVMLRRRKEDVLDLPEKAYIDEYVDMTPKQAKIYKEVSSEIKENIDQIKSASNPLAEMIRLRQATGYTGILSSTVQESAKLDRMEEIVEDTLENNEKVVIFSNWTSITDEVYRRLSQKYDVAVITGETKDEDRQRMVDKFQNTDTCKIMLGTTGAMGTGLTLTAGTVEIFLDVPWNRALYDQAVDRCHRIGQSSKVTIYNIMAKNTLDEKIWQLVNKKGKMSDAIVDGEVDLSKSELVDFLLAD